MNALKHIDTMIGVTLATMHLIAELRDRINAAEGPLDIDYGTHQGPLIAAAYMLDHLHDDLCDLESEIKKKHTPAHMPPKATLCGSDTSGKLAVLRMALGNMLNTHDEIELDHSNYLGVYELCCEIQDELDGEP